MNVKTNTKDYKISVGNKGYLKRNIWCGVLILCHKCYGRDSIHTKKHGLE